ncbi:hypothetical protein COOONC_01562 [Cooperia oncophora]
MVAFLLLFITFKVTVLLGHNGAGKSTTYSMICGSTSMTTGMCSIIVHIQPVLISILPSNEPTAGMDPHSRRIVTDFVIKQKQDRCILLSTHYMDEAEAMGDFVYIMSLGHAVCSGTPFFLKQK